MTEEKMTTNVSNPPVSNTVVVASSPGLLVSVKTVELLTVVAVCLQSTRCFEIIMRDYQ